MNIEQIKAEMWMYEHQPPAQTGEVFCEQCREVVLVGSPCTVSKYYPRWKELNSMLEEKKDE